MLCLDEQFQAQFQTAPYKNGDPRPSISPQMIDVLIIDDIQELTGKDRYAERVLQHLQPPATAGKQLQSSRRASRP